MYGVLRAYRVIYYYDWILYTFERYGKVSHPMQSGQHEAGLLLHGYLTAGGKSDPTFKLHRNSLPRSSVCMYGIWTYGIVHAQYTEISCQDACWTVTIVVGCIPFRARTAVHSREVRMLERNLTFWRSATCSEYGVKTFLED